MSLRWRIVIVAIIVATLPTAILGGILRDLTLDQTRLESEQRLTVTAETAAERVSERGRRERQAVARLCEGDLLVDRILLDLQSTQPDPLERAALAPRAPHLMRSMGLGALLLLDGGAGRYGRVLAAGHRPSGGREVELARAVESAGERWFVRRVDGQADEALVTGCVLERGGARIIAVGGHALDRDFVRSLAAGVPPVELVLTDAEGALPAGVASGGGRREVAVFDDVDGRPAARLFAVADDGPLNARLAELDRRLAYAIGIALGVAVPLGLLLAFSIVRPLHQLEGAASRVGSGDMTTTIKVRSTGEVGKVLKAFNRMTGELQHAQARLIRAERIAAWREIARRIAHEIKNPLMPIQTSIETMRKTHARRHPDFDEIFEESTLTILEEVERLKRIVTEFSRFARLPRPRPTSLAVEEVTQHVVGLHAGGDVLVTMEFEGTLPHVRADREQLTQVLVNLVQNAADAARARHGERGGRVHVVLSPTEGGGVRVEVMDNGPGIPEAERSRIFEPYYTTKASGTGLGLAIVHRIVSDHGGRVDIDEAEDGGAVFEVLLTRTGPPPEIEGSYTDSDTPLVRSRGD